MNNIDKYCLKWSEFEANIRESFRNLREEQRLFDVTLATDDGKHIKAHKMILAAGSHFFNDIFMNNDHTNMLIYLKGTSSTDLGHVIEFLYDGETNVKQEELKKFLETGQELQVKGLKGDYGEYGAEYKNNGDIVGKESSLDSLDSFKYK